MVFPVLVSNMANETVFCAGLVSFFVNDKTIGDLLPPRFFNEIPGGMMSIIPPTPSIPSFSTV
jgi:hypothetical protein